MNTTNNKNEKITAGTHIPYWIESTPAIEFDKLSSDSEVDVVIVGGGIAGVTIAYCLSESGKRVALVEDGHIGSGETGRTTAHLVTALDDRYYEFERIFGKKDTKLIAQSHALAIDFIERTLKGENIECDFKRVNGYLFRHPSDKPESLDIELEAALRAGLEVEKIKNMPGINGSGEALKFYNQAEFHPLKYLKGLCDVIIKNGSSIYTNTHAADINEEGITSNEGYKIKAAAIVVATNTPVNNKYRMHLKQFAYRTYVIGFKIKKDHLPAALWWDTGDFSVNAEIPPYHYIRTQKLDEENDLLLVGGEDHATGLADADNKLEEERYDFLEKWALEHFSQLGEMVYKWSGQVMEPMDSLAYIGKNPMDKDNIYIVTGDSGNGMTHSTIAGMLINDLIMKKENPWEKIYSPSRMKIFSSGKTLFKEFVGGLISYMKTKPGHIETQIKDIPVNEGRIIELNGKKCGAYRDEADSIHFVNTECTHLGCIVKWNNDEKSWDCPCHGSRFNYDGKVLNGPANAPLVAYQQKFDLEKATIPDAGKPVLK
jgi:glycine/D-amino acid oxidase-like deaminating enzyme/nitrite reductase/ring-hydroxylating ferredoxin subunit